MKKKVSTEKVALLMVWNMKFLSVTVRSVLFSAKMKDSIAKWPSESDTLGSRCARREVLITGPIGKVNASYCITAAVSIAS